jgi:hypothetical protein
MMSLAFTELLILDDFSLKERQGNGYPIVHLIILLIVSAYYPTKKNNEDSKFMLQLASAALSGSFRL